MTFNRPVVMSDLINVLAIIVCTIGLATNNNSLPSWSIVVLILANLAFMLVRKDTTPKPEDVDNDAAHRHTTV